MKVYVKPSLLIVQLLAMAGTTCRFSSISTSPLYSWLQGQMVDCPDEKAGSKVRMPDDSL